ncbi:MAG: hypothetical protein RLZZ546_2511 [Bacteroidota bacterium]
MRFLFLFLFWIITIRSYSQSPTDAELMLKSEFCIAAMYHNENWIQYWESTLLRENGNIGQLQKSSITPVLVYGLSNGMNVILGVNYIDAQTTQGTVIGNRGMQDIGMHIKYNFFNVEATSFALKNFVVVGGSLPISSYNEDAGPTSIGLGCSEIYSRWILDLSHNSGLFIRPAFAYHKRGSSTLDRYYYYDNKGYNSQFINIPNQTVSSLTLGVRLIDKTLRIETSLSKINTLGGSEIRRHDMPLANANMDATKWNAFLKFDPSFAKNFGFMLGYDQILNGQNVGKSTSIMIGINYRITRTHEDKNSNSN